MVLLGDGLLPSTQPNLGYEQEEVIYQLYPFDWDNRKNYIDWLCMHEVLDKERKKARCIEF